MIKILLSSIILLLVIACGSSKSELKREDAPTAKPKTESKTESSREDDLEPFQGKTERTKPAPVAKKPESSKSTKKKPLDNLENVEDENAENEEMALDENDAEKMAMEEAEKAEMEKAAKIAAGLEIYAAQCANCHNSDTIPEDNRVAGKSLAQLQGKLSGGHRGTNLTPEEIEELALAVEQESEVEM